MTADAHVERWLAAHRTPWLNHVTAFVTWLAETPTAIALAFVLFVGLRLWLHRWRESFIVLTALVGELLVFLLCTSLIDRSRPPVHHLDGAPPTSSFPSGHTGAAVALYGSLAVILLIHSGRRGLTWPVAALLMVIPVRGRGLAALSRDALPHRCRGRGAERHALGVLGGERLCSQKRRRRRRRSSAAIDSQS